MYIKEITPYRCLSSRLRELTTGVSRKNASRLGARSYAKSKRSVAGLGSKNRLAQP
jgi:hypothetical protein